MSSSSISPSFKIPVVSTASYSVTTGIIAKAAEAAKSSAINKSVHFLNKSDKPIIPASEVVLKALIKDSKAYLIEILRNHENTLSDQTKKKEISSIIAELEKDNDIKFKIGVNPAEPNSPLASLEGNTTLVTLLEPIIKAKLAKLSAQATIARECKNVTLDGDKVVLPVANFSLRRAPKEGVTGETALACAAGGASISAAISGCSHEDITVVGTTAHLFFQIAGKVHQHFHKTNEDSESSDYQAFIVYFNEILGKNKEALKEIQDETKSLPLTVLVDTVETLGGINDSILAIKEVIKANPDIQDLIKRSFSIRLDTDPAKYITQAIDVLFKNEFKGNKIYITDGMSPKSIQEVANLAYNHLKNKDGWDDGKARAWVQTNLVIGVGSEIANVPAIDVSVEEQRTLALGEDCQISLSEQIPSDDNELYKNADADFYSIRQAWVLIKDKLRANNLGASLLIPANSEELSANLDEEFQITMAHTHRKVDGVSHGFISACIPDILEDLGDLSQNQWIKDAIEQTLKQDPEISEQDEENFKNFFLSLFAKDKAFSYAPDGAYVGPGMPHCLTTANFAISIFLESVLTSRIFSASAVATLSSELVQVAEDMELIYEPDAQAPKEYLKAAAIGGFKYTTEVNNFSTLEIRPALDTVQVITTLNDVENITSKTPVKINIANKEQAKEALKQLKDKGITQVIIGKPINGVKNPKGCVCKASQIKLGENHTPTFKASLKNGDFSAKTSIPFPAGTELYNVVKKDGEIIAQVAAAREETLDCISLHLYCDKDGFKLDKAEAGKVSFENVTYYSVLTSPASTESALSSAPSSSTASSAGLSFSGPPTKRAKTDNPTVAAANDDVPIYISDEIYKMMQNSSKPGVKASAS